MTEFASGGQAFDLSEDGQLMRVVREPRPLCPAQAAMLRLLLLRCGQQVSEAELAQAGWGDPAPEGAVAAGVRAIQAALGDDPAAPLFIEALPQRGYRFAGGVTGQVAPAAAAPAEPAALEAVIQALCGAVSGPGIAPALADARAHGERSNLGPAYDRAVEMLMRAAEAGRGEPLPALALETVIDGLQAA